MLAIFGILLSLVLLMVLAYRGFSVIVLAPALALLAVAWTGEFPLLATYTEVFMKHLAGFVKAFFPLFLLGAIFGSLMSASGFAERIARQISSVLGPRHAILSVVLSCAVLTYGGVSLFVVAFAVYPIAAALYRRADIPKRLIPASLALGSFTFTMVALPGTPQIQNSIPMPYFGTTLYAAPTIGILVGLWMAVMGTLWLQYRSRKLRAAGEGYGDHADDSSAPTEDKSGGFFLVPWLPVMLVLGLSFVFSNIAFPRLDLGYLAAAPYQTVGTKVVGLWSLILALAIASAFTFALSWRRSASLVQAINAGVRGSLLAVINTASEVGYGNVIASLAAFGAVKAWILGVSSNPLVSVSATTAVLAGITGSASGGLSITLESLGSQYLTLATAAGINPEVLHRVSAIACSGLDALPHNGAVITTLTVCGLTHRESYFDIAVSVVLVPFLGMALAVLLGSMGVV